MTDLVGERIVNLGIVCQVEEDSAHGYGSGIGA